MQPRPTSHGHRFAIKPPVFRYIYYTYIYMYTYNNHLDATPRLSHRCAAGWLRYTPREHCHYTTGWRRMLTPARLEPEERHQNALIYYIRYTRNSTKHTASILLCGRRRCNIRVYNIYVLYVYSHSGLRRCLCARQIAKGTCPMSCFEKKNVWHSPRHHTQRRWLRQSGISYVLVLYISFRSAR